MNRYRETLAKLKQPLQYKNVIKLSKGNSESYAHKFVKFIVCNWALENNLEFATEVEFNGGRCDVVILSKFFGVEILHTENVKTFIKKSDVYPIPILPVRTELGHDEIVKILDDVLASGNVDYYRRNFK